MPILLTGFNPFAGAEINSSQLVVEHFARRHSLYPRLIPVVLPTEYEAAGRSICALIREYQPSVVLALGVAQNRTSISLERVALNLDDSNIPDNAGVIARGRLIDPDAPLAYWSTLPLEKMLEALGRNNIPAVISNHAGAFVCNHVFFTARHEIASLGWPTYCGFIHVPALAEVGKPDLIGLPLRTLIAAVECCLEVVEVLGQNVEE
ncbi:MAG: hypothetical protein H7175_25600 [Burkholderiales bacterium]|nr:hypothetical protein [Anaerolineae bacterium]